MKHKLYFIGENGSNVDKTGEYCIKEMENADFHEEWDSIEAAKKSAGPFLKANPLMSCVVYPGENGEDELVLVGDENAWRAAQASKQKEIKRLVSKKKKKQVVWSVISLLAVSIVVLLIFN